MIGRQDARLVEWIDEYVYIYIYIYIYKYVCYSIYAGSAIFIYCWRKSGFVCILAQRSGHLARYLDKLGFGHPWYLGFGHPYFGFCHPCTSRWRSSSFPQWRVQKDMQCLSLGQHGRGISERLAKRCYRCCSGGHCNTSWISTSQQFELWCPFSMQLSALIRRRSCCWSWTEKFPRVKMEKHRC